MYIDLHLCKLNNETLLLIVTHNALPFTPDIIFDSLKSAVSHKSYKLI